ncbi:MAG: hypothetical protein HY553_03455 [Elusimicrobia bacterium]|nr:hypothetical protein [Elusimicrobiota bacterium]
MPFARRTISTIAVAAAALLSIAIVSSSGERAPKPALAAEPAPTASPRSAAWGGSDAGPVRQRSSRFDPDLRIDPVATPAVAAVSTSRQSDATPPRRTEPPRRVSSDAIVPRATEARTPVTQSVRPAPATATPAQAPCPADWLCYERLGIAGPIVPYTDCTGKTDIGVGIRSFSCLSDGYLLGHGYTAFGRITEWKAGDRVSSRGREYLVTGAFTQAGCTGPRLPLAPLTLQTSLTATACGPILIVQAQ